MRLPPLRVPSVVPGKWVYLRGCSKAFGWYNRTFASDGASAWAAPDVEGGLFSASVRCEGLAAWSSPGHATLENAVAAMEAYLRSLGAEEVPDGEWPSYCVGDGFRPDRVPYGSDADADADYDAWCAAVGGP